MSNDKLINTKYFMTINIKSTEETPNIVGVENIEALLVYIYKALENNPQQRSFRIEITNKDGIY